MPTLRVWKVEDLTNAEMEGRSRIAKAARFCTGKDARLRECLCCRFRAADFACARRAPAAGRRRRDEGRRHDAPPFCRHGLPRRDYYTPFRAMLLKEVDQLIVAGRHYSSTLQAQNPAAADPRPAWRWAKRRVSQPLLSQCRNDRSQGRYPAIQKQMRAQALIPAGHSWRTLHTWRFRRNDDFATQRIRVIDFTQVMLGPSCTQSWATMAPKSSRSKR